MEITGTIKGISYQTLLQNNLTKIPFEKFDINNCPSSCNVEFDNNIISLSWYHLKEQDHILMKEFIIHYGVKNNCHSIVDEGQNGDRILFNGIQYR